MRIFVLEDDPERILILGPLLAVGRNEVDWCQSSLNLHRFRPPYDLILLDHDLGGRQMDDHEDNGLEFIRSIKGEIGDARVIIHSWNPGGAAAMEREWPAAMRCPFGGPRFHAFLEKALRE